MPRGKKNPIVPNTPKPVTLGENLGAEDDNNDAPLFAGPAPEAPEPVVAAAPVVRKKVIQTSGPRTYRIKVEESAEIPPTGLFLGHNGRSFMLKPGVPIDAPDFLIEILDHAIVTVPVIHPATNQVMGHRDKHRFPYQYLDRTRHASNP